MPLNSSPSRCEITLASQSTIKCISFDAVYGLLRCDKSVVYILWLVRIHCSEQIEHLLESIVALPRTREEDGQHVLATEVMVGRLGSDLGRQETIEV